MIHQTRKKNLVRKSKNKIIIKKIKNIYYKYRLNKEIKKFTEEGDKGDKGGKKIILTLYLYRIKIFK